MRWCRLIFKLLPKSVERTPCDGREKSKMRALKTEKELQSDVLDLAAEVESYYGNRKIVVVYMINSAAMFCADLVRRLSNVSSIYGLGFDSFDSGSQSGEVRITQDVATPISGEHVLLLEGMVISGSTPEFLKKYLLLRGAASVSLCAVGNKPALMRDDVDLPFCMYQFSNEWVAGYGIGSGPEKSSTALLDLSRS